MRNPTEGSSTTQQIYLGFDVGKSEHRACALTQGGQVVWNKPLPNDQSRLEEVYKALLSQGELLVVVDQPATIGALAIAVAQHMGIPVAYLPGLTLRRIADLHPGDAKTDQKDAFIIADAARSLPHTLRDITELDANEAALGMLAGFDLDLSRQVNQASNRIRGLYTQVHPALETVLGTRLEHDAILEVLTSWPTPPSPPARPVTITLAFASLRYLNSPCNTLRLGLGGRKSHTAAEAVARSSQRVNPVGTQRHETAGIID